MLDKNQKTDWGNLDGDVVDRELDAALAKYGAAEPRAGLEERVLARLQREPLPAGEHLWWRWGLAGALAAVMIAAAIFATRSERMTNRVITNPPSIAKTGPLPPTTAPLTPTKKSARRDTDRTGTLAVNHKITRRRPHSQETAAANTKLDQFPSPHPLTEQEKLALEYVREFPEEAALIARAQADFAQREELEKSQPAAASPGIERQE